MYMYIYIYYIYTYIYMYMLRWGKGRIGPVRFARGRRALAPPRAGLADLCSEAGPPPSVEKGHASVYMNPYRRKIIYYVYE